MTKGRQDNQDVNYTALALAVSGVGAEVNEPTASGARVRQNLATADLQAEDDLCG
jgi:hypothetical protein